MKPKFELGKKVIVILRDVNNLAFDVKLAVRIAKIVNIMRMKDVYSKKIIAIQYKVTTPGTILQTVNERDLYAHTASGVKELYSNFFTDYKDVLGAMMPFIFSTFTSLKLTKKEALDAITYIIKKHYSEEKQS